MANITRWYPYREMLALKEMMDQVLGMPRDGGFDGGNPDMDVIEKDDKFIVKAELPGFKAEQVDIRVEGNTLMLKGEYKEETQKQEGQYHIHERHQGNFMRTLNLPASIKVEKASAEFENGVLTLTLPKDEAALPKKIDIKAIPAKQIK